MLEKFGANVLNCVIFILPWYLRFTVGYRFLDEKVWKGTRSVEALFGLSCFFFKQNLVLFLKLKPFIRHFYFSGVQESESEIIDISSLPWAVKDDIRETIVGSGFADDRSDKYKLRPCPLGTFVDRSLTNPKCENCSAGKSLLLTLHNLFQ